MHERPTGKVLFNDAAHALSQAKFNTAFRRQCLEVELHLTVAQLGRSEVCMTARGIASAAGPVGNVVCMICDRYCEVSRGKVQNDGVAWLLLNLFEKTNILSPYTLTNVF